jgi:hypothetical protein
MNQSKEQKTKWVMVEAQIRQMNMKILKTKRGKEEETREYNNYYKYGRVNNENVHNE